MELIGITLIQFEAAVATVSSKYDGNLAVHDDAKSTSSRSSRGRVVTLDSHGQGSRRSWSGRHGKWACWHAYRDVMLALFEVNPDATIRTSLATYKGRQGFLDTYPGTAYHNIGSMVAPAYMPELCDCGG